MIELLLAVIAGILIIGTNMICWRLGQIASALIGIEGNTRDRK